jgi:hypothetical protein
MLKILISMTRARSDLASNIVRLSRGGLVKIGSFVLSRKLGDCFDAALSAQTPALLITNPRRRKPLPQASTDLVITPLLVIFR